MAQLQAILALLIFVPAGTVRYWQGWVYWATWAVCMGAMVADGMRRSPDLIARRMEAGPRAEPRALQKVVLAIAALTFFALPVVAALDCRLRWSYMSLPAIVAGDLVFVVGCRIVHLALVANRYAASTVRVEEGQTLADTGPYGVVRHPMYSGGIVLVFGTPLALGSLWAIVPAGIVAAAIVARLLDEERMLTEQLQGYGDYCRRVRWRLMPGVW